jgi:hypothetical protein
LRLRGFGEPPPEEAVERLLVAAEELVERLAAAAGKGQHELFVGLNLLRRRSHAGILLGVMRGDGNHLWF